MKKIDSIFLAVLLIFILVSAGAAQPSQGPDWKDLKGPGKKNWIDDSVYFVFKPSEKPKIGTFILKVTVFQKSGTKDKSFTIKGQFSMPSMAGAHDSGLKTLTLNNAGNYLLPLDIGMPGDWELKLTFLKADKIVFRGRAKFHV